MHSRIDGSAIAGQLRDLGYKMRKVAQIVRVPLDVAAQKALRLHLNNFGSLWFRMHADTTLATICTQCSPIRHVTLNQNQAKEATRRERTLTKQTADKQKRLSHVCVTNSCRRCCTSTVCILKPRMPQPQRYSRHCRRCWKCATFHCKWPATQRETHQWWEHWKKSKRWRVTLVASVVSIVSGDGTRKRNVLVFISVLW